MDSVSATAASLPRIIIVGGGFGGLAAAHALSVGWEVSKRLTAVSRTFPAFDSREHERGASTAATEMEGRARVITISPDHASAEDAVRAATSGGHPDVEGSALPWSLSP